MMTIAKNRKKTIGIWAIVCTLVISACFLLPLIQNQEAYAETKKVTGTLKDTVPLGCGARHSVLSSADPDWNNARFFSAGWRKFKFTKPGHFKGYGVITHPGGDQTFIQYVIKTVPSDGRRETGGSEWTGETEGFFISGTGKFKGIKARWMSKWKHTVTEGWMVEWGVEYF